MRKHLGIGLAVGILACGAWAQVSAPDTRLIARRGNSNPALNGFCYFYGSGPDITNGGTQPPTISATVETYDVDFNPTSSVGYPTVILTEAQSNSLIVCRADNGSQVHVIPNANTGSTEPDPVGLAISEDGVLFITNTSRSIIYRASDALDEQKHVLVPPHGTSVGTYEGSGIHCTGSVRDGTCRVYLGVGDTIWVYNVTGTLPGNLTPIIVTSFKPMDGTTGFTKIPAISGTRDVLHIVDNVANVRETVVLNRGADGVAGTADDFYQDAQAVADTQVAQDILPTGLSVLDRPEVTVGLPGAGAGVYAMFEGSGDHHGIAVGSLGTAAAPGVLVPAANGQFNDAEIAVDEDFDNDGLWDGGVASGGFSGGKRVGSVAVGKFNGEVNVWFVSSGGGAFGRLVLPQSTVPVALSGFTLE